MDVNILGARLLSQAADAVLVTSGDLTAPGPHILYANSALCQMTGYREEELIGKTPRIFQGADTDRQVLAELRRRLSVGEPFHGSAINYRKNGTPFYMEWHASPVLDADGAVSHFLSVHRDVTAHKQFERDIQHYVTGLADHNAAMMTRLREMEEANAHLLKLATTDGLTGLANHRHFHETLAQWLTTSDVSLLLLDVDRFKRYNDTFGHPAGDKVLQTLADMLRISASERGLAARYGGEEFALVLPGQDPSSALCLAEQVRASVEATAWPLRPVTVSIGAATAPSGTAASHLVEQADRALYLAKSQGRNCVRHDRAQLQTSSTSCVSSPLPRREAAAPPSGPGSGRVIVQRTSDTDIMLRGAPGKTGL